MDMEDAIKKIDGKKKVMVAIDESDCSAEALQWALENLKEKIISSGLLLFNVMSLDYGSVYGSTYGVAVPELITSIQENQKRLSAAILEKAQQICANHGIESETVSVLGNPKDALCEATEKLNIQLLVIGSHGKGAIQRAFLGSVSNYCVHNANCPVLVVRKASGSSH